MSTTPIEQGTVEIIEPTLVWCAAFPRCINAFMVGAGHGRCGDAFCDPCTAKHRLVEEVAAEHMALVHADGGECPDGCGGK